MSCIFISYRRADNAAGYSRSVAQSLRAEFGQDKVFRDIRSIPPGQDFPTFIRKTLASCRVMLVLIGTQWTRVTDDRGNRRLVAAVIPPTRWRKPDVRKARPPRRTGTSSGDPPPETNPTLFV